MTAPRIQDWTRENHPIRGDILRFRATTGGRIFNMHEDLLCASSKYFRNMFQMNRKPIEGACSICQQELDSSTHDVTFCRSGCGQNLHKTCLDTWANANTPPKCPMCRIHWEEGSAKVVTLDKELEDNIIQLYMDWLYREFLPKNDDVARIVGHSQAWAQYDRLLVKAWELSSIFQAKDFADLVVGRIIESMEAGQSMEFEDSIIACAYGAHGTSVMQRIAVNLCLVHIDAEYIAGTAARRSKEFFVDLSIAFFERADWLPTFDDITEEYVEGRCEGDEM